MLEKLDGDWRHQYFIDGSFFDADRISDYITLDDRMNGK